MFKVAYILLGIHIPEKLSLSNRFFFPSLVHHLIRDEDTEAEVARRIVAIPGRALGRVRLIVDVTDQSRNLDRSLPKGRRRSRRNPTNLTGRKRRIARTLG